MKIVKITCLLCMLGISSNTEAGSVDKCQASEECRMLAQAGYYEARGESDKGMMAVMQTVINRRNSPVWGDSIKSVVHAPKQFSFVSTGLKTMPETDSREKALRLAWRLLTNREKSPPMWDGITHFHSKQVNPSWARKMQKVVEIGNHVFYACKKEC